jgi:16S rRNA (cytosine967-C5)-methyltransferase
MLVGQLLAPEPGMCVLDVCAAPGGKTTHLAEYMHDEGYILANDIHPHKEKLIQTIAKRMGHSIIHTSVADARMLSEKRTERFDKVLVDAPCTGFGVIRRKPDLKWHKEARDVADIAVLQYQILSSASLLVKAGGQLVYSTCTIDKQENENVTDRFLDEHRSFTVVPGSTRLILPGEFGGDGFYMTKFVKQ